MKLKKKSTLIGAISVLAGVSVVSVGFASWVVSAGEKQEVTGTINVEDVSDQRHNIENLSQPANKIVKYGAPASVSGTTTGQVLSYQDITSSDIEHLNIESFTFTVKNWTVNSATAAKLTIVVSVKDQTNTWYKDLSTGLVSKTEPTGSPVYTGEGKTHVKTENKNGYEMAQTDELVGDLPNWDSSRSTEQELALNKNITVTHNHNASDASAEDFTVKLNFKWGSHFTGSAVSSSHNSGNIVNPYTYYNKDGADDLEYASPSAKNAAAADAVKSLSNLNAYLNGVKYTLTIMTEHVA